LLRALRQRRALRRCQRLKRIDSGPVSPKFTAPSRDAGSCMLGFDMGMILPGRRGMRCCEVDVCACSRGTL